MKARAICWASGLIELLQAGQRLPRGAIMIATAEDDEFDAFRDRVEVKARRGYDGTLLVPGVPEAETPEAAIHALNSWVAWAFPPKDKARMAA